MDEVSGSISIKINGKTYRKKLSLDTADRALSKMFHVASLELSKGDQTITLTYEGEPGKTIGLDFLQIQNQAKMK
jgi:hypothetical protein